ncbi:type II toxin-antitoxin system CcdA family antitoxin [Pseudomonas sp. UL073]|uniref:Type II toxin-antitoxin system CcdA family antitoxin n=2 Tax=Zestomonas insulae TaxID=2809017 RepID=A0ABS2IDE3_9GAMM|nr:type II toxin-antitoxin system CcdA family antitoxin [Pseudomonas insulae]MBM7061060.1 type II toxin-antitoxin system CcdA family antitoxin [Pseudomonas insulae]
MTTLYDSHAPKRAAKLRVNGDLLTKATELGINLSTKLEQALAEALRTEHRRRWLAENRTAISAYNQHVQDNGVFSDDLRRF